MLLCAVLGVVQYRSIGELSRAEHDRLVERLQEHLNGLSRDFNLQVTAASSGLLTDEIPADPAARERTVLERYEEWRNSSNHTQMVRRLALAVPLGDSLTLRILEAGKGEFADAEWPQAWQSLRQRLLVRAQNPDRRSAIPASDDLEDLIHVPWFEKPQEPGGPGLREGAWLIVQLDLDYLRNAVIPELIQHHLSENGVLSYDVQIDMASDAAKVIYRLEGKPVAQNSADASVHLFEPRFDPGLRRGGPARGGFGGFLGGPGDLGGRGPRPETGPGDRGRWLLSARHQSGSLEALVARARLRNLAITGTILALLIIAAGALLLLTRRAQRLAELQIEFVASVSHELRTPLTVMRTAGHNLQGKVAHDADRVRRYGQLVQDESEKLTAMVEEVLSFARAKTGTVIGVRQPLSVEDLIDDAVRADRRIIAQNNCVVEKKIESDLPPILGDRTTLEHALRNLLTNAAKYGKEGGWIGVSADLSSDVGLVDIRVSDRGAGIPPSEIGQIFEPFYRGKRALNDQIHGTGLGLSLTKRIVDAHGGTLTVSSEEGSGTEFVLRIPVAVHETQS